MIDVFVFAPLLLLLVVNVVVLLIRSLLRDESFSNKVANRVANNNSNNVIDELERYMTRVVSRNFVAERENTKRKVRPTKVNDKKLEKL